MTERWSPEEAWNWYEAKPWIIGCDYTPRTAINELEMWQKETFDPKTIDQELGWAARLGFNTVRVYLHDLVWEMDQNGFKKRINRFLVIASKHGIKPVFVLFDDCWNTEFKQGKQPEPKPGVHNSGWVQSPGKKRVLDPSTWGSLREYVTGILQEYGEDNRVLMWDLYNEPGNRDLNEASLGLLRETFKWARWAEPEQPLTVGVWYDNEALNEYQLAESDIITFHNYNDETSLVKQITSLKEYGRPLICTEYMARTRGSRFQTHLPIFKREKMGCINWGLVKGKTNTIYPWGSKEGTPEPEMWFHDILREDGSPFSVEEVVFIRKITGKT